MAKFTFDKASQRFRYKDGDRAGQYMSKAKARGIVQDRITREEKRIERIPISLLNDDLTLAQWEASMAERIKTLHVQSYLLGKGGTHGYAPARDGQVITPIIQEQYKYLRRFSEDIAAGKLSKAQIEQRASLYASAAWQTREHGKFISHRESGYAWEQSVLDRGAENCALCEYFAYLKVVAIGVVSLRNPPGTRTCKAKCRCHMDYFVERPGGVKQSMMIQLSPSLSLLSA